MEDPTQLRFSMGRTFGAKNFGIKFARQKCGIHFPIRLQIERSYCVVKRVVFSGVDDVFAFVGGPKSIGDDDIAEGYFFAIPGAYSAHGEARRVQFVEQLFSTNCRRLFAHFPDPSGGDREGLSFCITEISKMNLKTFGVARFAPTRVSIEHGGEFVLYSREDKDVDEWGRIALGFAFVHVRPRIGEMRAVVKCLGRAC